MTCRFVPPVWYDAECGTALALVRDLGGLKLLISSEGGGLEAVDFREVVAQAASGGWMLRIAGREYITCLPTARGGCYRGYQESPKAYYNRLLRMYPYIIEYMPAVEYVEKWWRRARGDPLTWLRWELRLVREHMTDFGHVKDRELLEEVKLFELLSAAYTFAYAFDHLPQVVVSAPAAQRVKGRGGAAQIAKLIVELVLVNLPYVALLGVTVPHSVFDAPRIPPTLRTLVSTALFDFEYFERENISTKGVVATLRQVTESNVKYVGATIPGGMAAVIRDSPLLERVPLARYLPKISVKKAPFFIREEHLWKLPSGEEDSVSHADFRKISLAIFLAGASTVHKAYETLNKSFKDGNLGRWADLPPYILKSVERYMPLITTAEILGNEYVYLLKRRITPI